MNFFSQKPCLLLLLSVVVALAGCKTKPRPVPIDTSAQTGITASPSPFEGGGPFGATGLVPRSPGSADMGTESNRGLLQAVFFDFDQSAIKQSERAKVQEAAKYLNANPQHRLLLEGHCDWRGTAEYNLGLGDRRANTVREFIKTLGVSSDRLETLSKGDLDAVENASQEAMAKDRRVEFVILK